MEAVDGKVFDPNTSAGNRPPVPIGTLSCRTMRPRVPPPLPLLEEDGTGVGLSVAESLSPRVLLGKSGISRGDGLDFPFKDPGVGTETGVPAGRMGGVPDHAGGVLVDLGAVLDAATAVASPRLAAPAGKGQRSPRGATASTNPPAAMEDWDCCEDPTPPGGLADGPGRTTFTLTGGSCVFT